MFIRAKSLIICHSLSPRFSSISIPWTRSYSLYLIACLYFFHGSEELGSFYLGGIGGRGVGPQVLGYQDCFEEDLHHQISEKIVSNLSFRHWSSASICLVLLPNRRLEYEYHILCCNPSSKFLNCQIKLPHGTQQVWGLVYDEEMVQDGVYKDRGFFHRALVNSSGK